MTANHSHTFWTAFLVLPFFVLTAGLSASAVIPAAPQTKPIILQNGTVHTVSGEVLENADVIFIDGRISALGSGLRPPRDAEIISIEGLHVYPGLIAAHTRLGLQEINAVRATVDVAETGRINPNARAHVALNPDSELLPVARSNGILTALSVPRSQSELIGGMSAVIRLDGWTSEDLTVKAEAVLHVYWPSMTLNRDPRAPKSLEDQQKEIDERLRELDDAFAAARSYAQGKTSAAAAGQPMPETDLRWESMIPVFSGELPVFVHAQELKQITDALAWAKKQQLRITIVGGADAWRVAGQLAESDVPVILVGTNNLPLRRDDGFDAPFANPERLHAAGVRFCIAQEADAPNGFGNERNLPYEAGKAVAYGLPHDEALKAITLYPAQLLGVGDELGSIEIGKRATLMITDGDPMETPTGVQMAFIDGRRIDLTNKQTALRDKYAERLHRLQSR